MNEVVTGNVFAALKKALADMRAALEGDAGQVLAHLPPGMGSTASLMDWAVDTVAEALIALRVLVRALQDIAEQVDPMLALIETGAGALPESMPGADADVGGSLGQLLAAITQGVGSTRQALDSGLEMTRLWPSIADLEAVSRDLEALIGSAESLPVDGLLGRISTKTISSTLKEPV